MRKINYKFKKTNICIYVSKSISKNPKVLLHGFTGSYKSWYDISKKLKDYILIDIPGHGHSDFLDFQNDYNFENFATDINYIFKDLEIHKVNLIGYSLGGRLAIIIAKTYPKLINKLILESSGFGLASEEELDKRFQQDLKLANLIEADFSKFLKLWDENPLFTKQKNRNIKIYEKQKIIRSKQKPLQLSKSLKSFSQGKMKSCLKNFTNFDFPVVLICGGEDRKYLTYADLIFDLSKHVNQYIVPKSGHNIHLENPDKFLKILLDND